VKTGDPTLDDTYANALTNLGIARMAIDAVSLHGATREEADEFLCYAANTVMAAEIVLSRALARQVQAEVADARARRQRSRRRRSR
jgi:phosphoglycerate dehydrogenase-like enzyme